MRTIDIQRSLKTLGYDPGPLDGIRGRLTMRAIREYQADHGLVVDGIVGPQTALSLNPSLPAPDAKDNHQLMPWVDEAQRLRGIKEISGPKSNKLILDWADDLDLWYPDDDIPWCGLFVAHCIGSQLPNEPLPDNPLGARNWSKFGVESTSVYGSILVFWRGKPNGWKGHVGFYASEDSTTFHVLGGNQSNSVSIARVAKNRLIGARWPLTAPNTGDQLIADLSGKISTNEA